MEILGILVGVMAFNSETNVLLCTPCTKKRGCAMWVWHTSIKFGNLNSHVASTHHGWNKLKYNELYFILGFNEFLWIDSPPIRMAPNPHHSQKWIFRNMKFEVRTSQFALNTFKKQIRGGLNFENAPLKLQRTIKFKKTLKRERRKEGQP